MAVVVIQEFEATPEEYDQVNEKLGAEIPEGGSCTRPGSGRRQDEGDRRLGVGQHYQRFVQDQLIPAIAEVNPDAPEAGEPDIRETYDLQQA